MAGILFRVRIPPWARHHFEGKPRLVRRFETEDAGDVWVAQVEEQVRVLKAGGQLSALGVKVARRLSFKAASGLWLSEKEVRSRTFVWYQGFLNSHLNTWFGEHQVSQIGRALLSEYKAYRRGQKASANSITTEIKIVRTILAWAREEGYTVDESAWKLELPEVRRKKTRKFDPDRVDRLMAASSGRDLAILQVLAWSGMRAGELRAFDASWIRWNQDHIWVPDDESFSPKGKDGRPIPLHAPLRDALSRWLGKRRQGLVFPPMTPGRRRGDGWVRGHGVDVERLVARVTADAGITGITAHDLRHHWVSWMLSLGFTATEVQKWSGHKHLRTLQKYAHSSPTAYIPAVARINAVVGQQVGSEMGSGQVLEPRAKRA